MAVTAEIKSKDIQTITIPEIAKLKKLSYGILNHNYSLIKDKIGQYTILYDPNSIGRGIEVSYKDQTLSLILPLPTTIPEIELFYSLIECICKKLKIKQFTLDEETTTLGYPYHFIETYKEISSNALLNMEHKIQTEEVDQFLIFGALNPISLGKKEMNEIDASLEGFANLLNRLQQLDVFYANPIIYQRKDDSLFGVYHIEEEIPTVLPKKPYLLNKELADKIDSWYVQISSSISIPYEDFISNVNQPMPYDYNHFVVCLLEEEIQHFVFYHTDMITKEKQKDCFYWGKILDIGSNHSNKVKHMNLDTNELSGYNHIAIYLRWCIEHELLSDQLLKLFPELPSLVKEKKKDLRQILKEEKRFQGQLRLGHLNPQGKQFSKEYYVFNSEDNVSYPKCVDLYAEKYFGTQKYHSKEFKNEAYLFVPYNEEYYQGLSKYIDEAWERFLEKEK